MQLKLFKYEGAGNDFIAIDGRAANLPAGESWTALVQALCHRRRGLGADGVLVLQDPDSPKSDFRMAYFNSDGSEGEMCGNGSRCIARFAYLMGAAPGEMSFQTPAGPYSASLDDQAVTVSFPEIPGQPLTRKLHALGRDWDTDFLEVGVPHLIVWVDDLDTLDVNTFGRALRRHEALAPRGANINFAQPSTSGTHDVDVRTYERGVEEETLACGTGSSAAAISFCTRRKRSGRLKVKVLPTGKEMLSFEFNLGPESIQDVTMTGPARLVYIATVTWDAEKKQIRPFDFEMAIR